MAMSNGNMLILVMTYITVFMDTVNYSLVVPILPYLVKEYNSTSFQEGIIFSAYSICQLISLVVVGFSWVGLLIMGPLSDIYGRKPFLLLSLVGSCFGRRWISIIINRLYFPRNV